MTWAIFWMAFFVAIAVAMGAILLGTAMERTRVWLVVNYSQAAGSAFVIGSTIVILALLVAGAVTLPHLLGVGTT